MQLARETQARAFLGAQMSEANRQRVGGIGRRRFRQAEKARTMKATCALSAEPLPTVACLIRFGAYSKTGRPRSVAAMMAEPRAAPKVIAVL